MVKYLFIPKNNNECFLNKKKLNITIIIIYKILQKIYKKN